MKTDKVFNNVLPWTNVQVRNGAFPLEQYSIFSSFDDAKTYALSNAVAYEGQIIAVTEDGKQKVYVLDSSNTETGLRVVGDNTATVELSTKLYGTAESDTDGDIGQLSAKIKEIQEVALGELSSYELSVWSTESTEDGILKTYHLKQGDTRNFTIDIPKDFLVKSATLETVIAADVAEGGKLAGKDFEVGDKYIDFVINAKADASEVSHVYLNVKDLVDVYTGLSSDTIELSVNGTQISAYVRDGSIAKKHLAEDVINWGKDLSSNSVTVANAYTDTTINTVSVALSNDYVKKIGDTQAAANTYTDEQLTAHDTAAKELLAQVSANAVTSALNDAKTYTDEQITEKIGDIDFSIYAISSDVSAELCAVSVDLKGQIGQTLTDAKAYTNEICASISTTVDQKIDALNIGQYAISTDVKAELCAISAETLVIATADAKAKVDAEVTSRTEAIQALSDALSGDVKALAEDYGKVKTEYATVSADYKVVSADHKGRIETLENHITSYANISGDFALSDDVKVEIAAAKDAANKYTDEKVASIGDVLHFIGVVAVPEGMDLTASEGYQALYPDGKTPAKGDVVLDSVSGNEYVYADNYKGEASWVVIGDENNHATKTELKAEEDTRKATDAYLSGAIDNKLFCGNYGNVLSVESLSVVKISQDEYHNLVVNDEVDDKVVYIVNNDGAYNMYGETISELSTTGIEGTSEAANTLYVDEKVKEAKDAIPLSVSQLIWDIEEIYCGNATN